MVEGGVTRIVINRGGKEVKGPEEAEDEMGRGAPVLVLVTGQTEVETEARSVKELSMLLLFLDLTLKE